MEPVAESEPKPKVKKNKTDPETAEFLAQARWVQNLKGFEDCKILILNKLSHEFLFVSTLGKWAFNTKEMESIRIRPNSEIKSIKTDANSNLIIGLDFFKQPLVKYISYNSEYADTQTRRELKNEVKQIATQLKSLRNYFNKQSQEKKKE